MKRDPRSTRDISIAQQAAIPDADLWSDETTTVVTPESKDWASIKGHWDPTCTNFNPNQLPAADVDVYGAMWAAYVEGDFLP
jgi:hypothetical protein